MAMYVSFDGKDGNFTHQFHVGSDHQDAFKELLNTFKSFEYSCELQADGHELEYILDQIKGIPFAENKRVVRWFDSDARFILANLKFKW